MPKYWGKQIFTPGRFPEVGQKQKTEREKKTEKKRLNDGNNNGHLRIETPPRVAHARQFRVVGSLTSTLIWIIYF